MEKKNVTNQLTKILDHCNENIDLTLSYSKLSDFDRNGATSLVRHSEVDNDGIKLGSLVDDLLFNDNDYFKDNYYLFDGDKPTATLGALVNIILKNYNDVPSVDEVLKIIKNNNFWGNIKKQELLVSNFDKAEFWDYLKCKFESVGKTVISRDEYNTALELIAVLKEHPYSKHVLKNNFENVYQIKFTIPYKQFNIRGIIDIASFDHENKIVYLIDLKTGKNPSIEFEKSFIKWRYYFQAAIYTLAFEEICKHFKLNNYTLAPFQFLYISKSDKIPMIYEVTDKWIKAAFNGFKLDSIIYKGIDELIDEIYWSWKNKEYTIPKYIAENQGRVKLNDNYLLVNE